MWDIYFSQTSGMDCERLKISDSLKDYHSSSPRTVTEDSKPENSNQSWPIDMVVSNAHLYLDYVKIRQTLSMNKVCLLIFMMHPEFQQSKKEIKELFRKYFWQLKKIINLLYILIYSHFLKYCHLLIELWGCRIVVKGKVNIKYNKYGLVSQISKERIVFTSLSSLNTYLWAFKIHWYTANRN